MNDPRDAEVEEANSRLTEGLKSCQVLVSSYRAMIAGEQTHEHATGEVAQDES